MTKNERTRRSPAAFGGPVLGLALIAAFSVAGCTSVPDAVNPVEWYKSTVDFFAGEDEETETAEGGLVGDRGRPAPGADKPIPKLSTVPERPRVGEAPKPIVEGLVADRERARYSTEVIRRQGEPARPLGARAVAGAPPPPPSPPSAAPSAAPARQAAAIPTAPPSPPAVAPTTSSPEAGVEAIYRARLAQQRPGQLTPPSRAPANALVPGAPAPDTVVVSSLGVSAQAAPRPPAATLAVPVATATPGGSVKVATIIFSHGSSRIDARDRRILENVVKLHAQSGGKVRVVGHASSRTRSMSADRHTAANLRVSQRRADAVARELTRHGLGREAVSVVARSDGEPIYYEVMPSGEAGNRRAEVFIDY